MGSGFQYEDRWKFFLWENKKGAFLALEFHVSQGQETRCNIVRTINGTASKFFLSRQRTHGAIDARASIQVQCTKGEVELNKRRIYALQVGQLIT